MTTMLEKMTALLSKEIEQVVGEAPAYGFGADAVEGMLRRVLGDVDGLSDEVRLRGAAALPPYLLGDEGDRDAAEGVFFAILDAILGETL